MKDPTMDLWTLPIVGSAGKTSPMNTHDEQDTFVNLREEFMEGASAAHSFMTSSQIKKFLTDKDCELMLVEPHNHRVNAATCAIQTFKDHFISALATTDSKFSLQLWDTLTSQVKTTLKLMRVSCINPSISAYEAIWGPYDWNRFPLAPPGCKVIIYESPAA